MIKVFIAEDLLMLRTGLELLLMEQKGIEFAGSASNGCEALDKIVEIQPDVVVTDIQMPEMDGIELTRELKKFYPKIHVIALTMYQDDHLIVDMLEAGARGYILKACGKEDLADAVRCVQGGGFYFCDNTTMKLSKLIAGSNVDVFQKTDRSQFTETEIEIIKLICEQYSSKEISNKLNLGLRTIEGYRHKIFEKMNAKNMAGVAIYAIRSGIFKP